MAFFTDNFLHNRRTELLRSVDRFQYQLNKKTWYDGKINDAMRSTMSIPGIFAPLRVDGMVLVDGGLRDNYPTALAKDMGADIPALSPELIAQEKAGWETYGQ